MATKRRLPKMLSDAQVEQLGAEVFKVPKFIDKITVRKRKRMWPSTVKLVAGQKQRRRRPLNEKKLLANVLKAIQAQYDEYGVG